MKLYVTPTATELLAAVREFLQNDVMPATDGHLSFHARVAANVLQTVERELSSAKDDEWATERISTLGVNSEAELAEKVRAAASLDELNGVLGVLDELTSARLEASNPKYLAEVTDDDPTQSTTT
ncbi:DUF6285 domain-containing protein [Cumulibacter soli]|uniref:DUF6285 domain-containing protein n=1 Tax=Cumulibacter soli TaxID=2546344 RepID=UPI001068B99F|nr:DUF6285 domain-containing protein [Cumulibacter soli]